MDFPIPHADFESNPIRFRMGTWFSSPKLLRNGVALRRINKVFLTTDDQGRNVELTLRRRTFDPLPDLWIDGHPVSIAPPFTWQEVGWICFPLVFVFFGGMAGILIGLLSIRSTARILRSPRSKAFRYGYSALRILLYIGVFALIAYSTYS